MNIYKLFTPQLLTLTLDAGTTGTADITVDGHVYEATFDSTLTLTATNFFNLHAAAIFADSGFVVTNPSAGVLVFTSSDARVAVITIGNPSTDLDGTPSAAQAAIAGVELTTSGIAEGGNITILQIQSADGVFEDNALGAVDDAGFLMREVKSENDLIAFATGDSVSLSRTANDGSVNTVLV